MLLFAHTGITLGVATIVAAVVNRREKKSWLVSLSKYADIRFLVIGSMLPDIIDKPIGHTFFSNGRIFSHTLLFLMFVTVIGVIAYKKRGGLWGFSLAVGVLTHLLLDSMWLAPKTLFWPLMGWGFEREVISEYADMIFHELITNPAVFFPETTGLIILIWFSLDVIRKKQVGALLKNHIHRKDRGGF